MLKYCFEFFFPKKKATKLQFTSPIRETEHFTSQSEMITKPRQQSDSSAPLITAPPPLSFGQWTPSGGQRARGAIVCASRGPRRPRRRYTLSLGQHEPWKYHLETFMRTAAGPYSGIPLFPEPDKVFPPRLAVASLPAIYGPGRFQFSFRIRR